MNTTKVSPTKKTAGKIPEVKHFYDSQAVKKVKQLTKKALNSNLVKHSGKKSGAKGKKDLFGAALAAPVAIQIGTFAVLAAGGYALWKNRDKIKDLIGGISDSDAMDSRLT